MSVDGFEDLLTVGVAPSPGEPNNDRAIIPDVAPYLFRTVGDELDHSLRTFFNPDNIGICRTGFGLGEEVAEFIASQTCAFRPTAVDTKYELSATHRERGFFVFRDTRAT